MVNFFKKETVFCIATLLALVSCFFVMPSLSYISWTTLLILLIMMVIVQFLKALGLFDLIVGKLLIHVKNVRQLYFILVFSCFFFSPFITNDIALLTFVPFAITALKKIKREDLAIVIITLQTIAANLGCMIFPLGAPHNIYLFSIANMSMISFIGVLFPYWVLSLVLLIIVGLFIPPSPISDSVGAAVEINKTDLLKRTISGVDYFLLLTFISFYILIGNLQAMPVVSNFFNSIIDGREILCSILASQIVSNVPGAMMIAGFSQNYPLIIIGINIGGLGTLIASMANLISYKIYAEEFNGTKGKFLLQFSIINLVFLFALLALYNIL